MKYVLGVLLGLSLIVYLVIFNVVVLFITVGLLIATGTAWTEGDM